MARNEVKNGPTDKSHDADSVKADKETPNIKVTETDSNLEGVLEI